MERNGGWKLFRNFFFEKLSKIPCSHFLPFFRPFLTRKFFWAKSIFFEREHLLLFLFCQEKDFVCSLLPLFCFDLTTHLVFFLDATLYLFKGPEEVYFESFLWVFFFFLRKFSFLYFKYLRFCFVFFFSLFFLSFFLKIRTERFLPFFFG